MTPSSESRSHEGSQAGEHLARNPPGGWPTEPSLVSAQPTLRRSCRWLPGTLSLLIQSDLRDLA